MFVNEKTQKVKALEFAKKNGWIVRFLKDELKNDFEIGLEAVKNNGKTIRELGVVLRKNKQIVIEASSTFPNAYLFADKSILEEKEIIELKRKFGPKV